MSNFEKRKGLVTATHDLFSATSIAPVNFYRKNRTMFCCSEFFGTFLIHFNPMFHYEETSFSMIETLG